MAEEIAFENIRISNFEGLMTLTLDRVTLHTVVHHSSTSTYMPNFIGIEETFCGRKDRRTDEHLRPTLLGRLSRVDLKSVDINHCHCINLDAADADCTAPTLLTAAAVATWTANDASFVFSADAAWLVGGGLPDSDIDGSSGSVIMRRYDSK